MRYVIKSIVNPQTDRTALSQDDCDGHEYQQWRNYGRQWRQSPQGAPGKGAPRADNNVFFILFNYKILSRFVAANDTALNTLRPIRLCFTANNNQLGL